MTVIGLCLSGESKKITSAATKATLSAKKIIMEEGCCTLYINNYNTNAKYTYSISNKKIFSIVDIDRNVDNKNQLVLEIYAEDIGTTKITIKETIGQKVRKVGTCIVENKKNYERSFFIEPEELSVANGCKFNLDENSTISAPGKVSFRSSNSSVASITKDGIVTTKKPGTIYITVKSGKETKKMKLRVLDKKLEKEYANHVEAINQLAAKKVTASNFTSYYKKYMQIKKKDEKYRSDNWSSIYNKQYIKTPYLETSSYVREKLTKYLRATKKLTLQGSSLDILKIEKLNAGSKTMKITLKKKLTKEDIMYINLLEYGVYDTYKKTTKANCFIRLQSLERKGYLMKATGKVGQKILTAKYSPKNTEKLRKGQTYYFMFHNSNSFQVSTLKAK